MTISYEQFTDVDIRLGTIVKTDSFPRARKPAYKVWVDFGEEIGVKQTSAQITTHYDLDELVGKQVLGCVNLGEKNIAGFRSEFLLLGFSDESDAICLATTLTDAPNGAKLC